MNELEGLTRTDIFQSSANGPEIDHKLLKLRFWRASVEVEKLLRSFQRDTGY
jgi:hypothetical protein